MTAGPGAEGAGGAPLEAFLGLPTGEGLSLNELLIVVNRYGVTVTRNLDGVVYPVDSDLWGGHGYTRSAM